MGKSTLTLAEIPSVSTLYRDRALKPTSEPAPRSTTLPTPARTSTFNERVHLIRHDITRLRLTAIVNAANGSLLGGGGVDGAIHRGAGPGLRDECEGLGGCDTGDAKVTRGHDLPARHVIHAVGPVYASERRRDEERPERLLASCYVRSLELASRLRGGGEDDEGPVSVGFSGLSTGIYGYPKGDAARVAIGTVLGWLVEEKRAAEKEGRKERVGHVVFVCFEEVDYQKYINWLPRYCPETDGQGQEPGLSGGFAAEADGQSESRAQDTQGSTTDAMDSTRQPEERKDAAHGTALELPDAPTTEPKVEGEPDSKKIKTV